MEDLEELNEEIDQSNGPFQGHHQPNGPFQCHQILRKDASITNKTKHSFHFFSKILFTFFKKYDLVVFTLFPKNNFFFFSQFKEKINFQTIEQESLEDRVSNLEKELEELKRELAPRRILRKL